MDTYRVQRRDCALHGPSMEPWLSSHGYGNYTIELAKILLFLQWSHDLSAMDTLCFVADFIRRVDLQWSHDLSAMDTRAAR